MLTLASVAREGWTSHGYFCFFVRVHPVHLPRRTGSATFSSCISGALQSSYPKDIPVSKNEFRPLASPAFIASLPDHALSPADKTGTASTLATAGVVPGAHTLPDPCRSLAKFHSRGSPTLSAASPSPHSAAHSPFSSPSSKETPAINLKWKWKASHRPLVMRMAASMSLATLAPAEQPLPRTLRVTG